MQWVLEPPRGTVCGMLRRGIRARRREKGRGGHRFKYADVKELYAAYTAPLGQGGELIGHILVTHIEDPVWQHWCCHPEDGWILRDWYASLEQAQEAAVRHSWDPVQELPEPDGREPGIYVLASWPGRTGDPMRVHCHSKNVAIVIADIFRGLGCTTEQETVAA